MAGRQIQSKVEGRAYVPRETFRQAKTDRLTKRQERGRETNIEEMADKETVEHRSKDSHKEEEI